MFLCLLGGPSKIVVICEQHLQWERGKIRSPVALTRTVHGSQILDPRILSRDSVPRRARGAHHTNRSTNVAIIYQTRKKPGNDGLATQDPRTSLLSIFNRGRLKGTITSARLGPSTIQGANLRPELPKDILTALKRYSAIRGIKDDAW